MTRVMGLVDLLKADQAWRWPSGQARAIEAYLDEHPQLQEDPQPLFDLVCNEILLRRQQGQAPSFKEYLQRFEPLARLREWFLATAGEAAVKTLVLSSVRPDPLLADLTPHPQGSMCFPRIPGYEILAEVGRGGMGVVYKARHLQLKRLVALKMILAGPCANSMLRDRFRTEAEAVARLQHLGIVQIHEVGEHNELPFLALEYVDGPSLDQAAADPVAASEAARLVEAIARAMHHAHRRHILHRDLKPSNTGLAPGWPVPGISQGVQSAASPLAPGRTGLQPTLVLTMSASWTPQILHPPPLTLQAGRPLLTTATAL